MAPMTPTVFGVASPPGPAGGPAGGAKEAASRASEESELARMQKWVPPSQDKPRERPLVRKVTYLIR